MADVNGPAMPLGEDLLAAKEVKPLPEGLYPVRLKKVSQEPNKSGDGFNLVWSWEIFGTKKKDVDGRPIDGRFIPEWSGLPKPGDESDYWASGQTAKEGKLVMIRRIVEAMKYKLKPDDTTQTLINKLPGSQCNLHLRPGKDPRGMDVNQVVDHKPL